MTTEERRYTLDEARKELAREKCARSGHDWSIGALRAFPGLPTYIYCDTCGYKLDVVTNGAGA